MMAQQEELVNEILMTKLNSLVEDAKKLSIYLRLNCDDEDVVDISNNIYLDATICIKAIETLKDK